MSPDQQFSSVQDGIYALGKAHMRSTPSLSSFPKVAFQTVPVFARLTIALSRPFKEDRLALPLSTPLLQAIRGVVSLALCPQVVSQAPQHFRSSEKQATCEGCFARQSYVLGHFPSLRHVQGVSTPTGGFRRWMSTIDTFQSGFPITFQSGFPIPLFHFLLHDERVSGLLGCLTDVADWHGDKRLLKLFC